MLDRLLRLAPRVAFAALAVLAMCALEPALAANGLGHPLPDQIGMQQAASPIAHEIHQVYDLVNIIIIAIAIFVLLLMIYVMFRFRESANPTPSVTTHNVVLEVAWTVIPILILVVIAIPSFKLLMNQYTYPPADVTIKAIGNAWFWEHQYPELGEFTVTSNMMSEEEAKARTDSGIPTPRLLGVDHEIAVPVNKNVHVLVTSNDVIHDWTIPSFGSKIDAVPGRITSTWFRAEKEGIFYGQCSELCGLNHAFMPIGVRVVSDDVFNQWIAALKEKGGAKKAQELLDKVALEQAKVAASGADRKQVAGASTAPAPAQ